MKEVVTTPLDAPERLRVAKVALNSGVIIEFRAPESQVKFIHSVWIKFHEAKSWKKLDKTITVHAIDGGIYGFLLSDISAVLNGFIPPPAEIEVADSETPVSES